MNVKSAKERNVNSGRPRTSKTVEDAVVKMYNDDYKVSDICEICNISRSTLYRILRERRAEQDGE